MGARPWDCEQRRIEGLPRDYHCFPDHISDSCGNLQLFFITLYESNNLPEKIPISVRYASNLAAIEKNQKEGEPYGSSHYHTV